MEFRILGPLVVSRDDVRLDLGTPKARLLLAVLLCRPGVPVSDESLAAALWGDAPPKSAAKNVQTYVHRLRQCLGDPARLERQGSGYLVSVTRGELDSARFEDLAAAGRATETAGELEDAGRRFHEALQIWRGPAFAGLTDVPMLAMEAARLEEVRLSVLERRIAVDLRLGRHADLLGELTALTGEYPLRERLWAQLMLALYRCGRRADALAAFTRARKTLVEETGLDPGDELRDLHQRILGQEVTPEPPPKTRPRMLPSGLGDFTGRQDELDEIVQALGSKPGPDAPAVVVAVSGRGGAGKTTLAVQAAHRLRREYPDGQLFATLAGTRSQPTKPYAVLGRFLRALGMPATAVPDDKDERAELYRSLLAERRVLVVLDDARDEEQLAPLLPGSGTCGVIVTGRVRLGGLAAAHRVELGELRDADGAALLRNIAGDRLTVARPDDLRTLMRLCAGLPLALRIAGSLLVARPHYRVADLIVQLGDARHRLDGLNYRGLEVRASFALSYQGLPKQTQQLFRLLGLLDAPDFALWAAAAVLDTEPATAQRLMDELVDVHLLDVTTTPEGQVRYRFHDLVRVYARERAEEEDSAEARGQAVIRKLSALLALTEIVHRAHMGDAPVHGNAPRWHPDRVEASLPKSVAPMQLLVHERPALPAGVRQAARLGADELCWELAVGGEPLFQSMRFFDDWQETYQEALTTAETAGNLRGQAMLMMSLAALHFSCRRFGPAEDHNTRAMRLFERIGDRWGYAQALGNAPFLLVPAGRLKGAVAHGEEAYRLLIEAGQTPSALDSYAQVGVAHLHAGRPEAAVPVLTEVIEQATTLGNRVLMARERYWLGLALLDLGRYDEAEASFAELSKREDDLGEPGRIYAAHAWGRLHLARGEYPQARHRLLDGLNAAREISDVLHQTRIIVDLLELHLRAGDDPQTGLVLGKEAVELAREVNYPLLLTNALERLARLYTAAGDPAEAQRLAEEATRIRARIG